MMVDVGRRKFLSGAGIAVASVAAANVSIPQAKAAPAPARVNYPSSRLLLAIPTMKRRACRSKSASVSRKGPERDIVGFATTCPHKGFPLSYNKSDRTLNWSLFPVRL
jgi:arsenite oxidase small subunit